MAPEVLLKQRYGNRADSWSLGVVLFELLTNQHPYISDAEEKIKLASLKNMANLKEFECLSCISEEAQDLLSKLLVPSQDERISVADALKHPWCQGSQI